MDITRLNLKAKADKGAVLTIVDPVTNLDTDLKITLAGTDSEIYRNYIKNSLNKKMNVKNKPAFNFDQSEYEGAELLAELTLGWEGMTAGKEEVPFTKEKALELYLDPGLKWLKEQVDAFIADRSNFF